MGMYEYIKIDSHNVTMLISTWALLAASVCLALA